MKIKGLAMTALVLGLTFSISNVTFCEDPTVTVIGGSATNTSGSDLTEGESVTIDKVCDLTYLGYTADNYAMSIAAYSRDNDESIEVPKVKGSKEWGKSNRFKLKENESKKPSYLDVYTDIGAAVVPSSEDYMLVDVRLNVLNRSTSPLSLNDVKATLKYNDEYPFDLTIIKMEESDGNGHSNEWLADIKDIPTLIDRNVHFIFEVPKLVATDTSGTLNVTFDMFDENFDIEVR